MTIMNYFIQHFNRIHRKYSAWIVMAFLFLLGAGCAQLGSPYGGPVDKDPPVVIKTKPPQNSVNFEPKDKIVIYFDEFVQLKDVYQEMMVSPPIEGNPIPVLRGRAIQVDIPREAEFDSTTYTISFGNAIADNNEGNVLENYQYIFSLKGYIDSMNVEGKVVSAFDHQPDKERMLVMLYANLNDSAPLLEKPSYVARTNPGGEFVIPNLECGSYRVFALKDGNGNLRYDLSTEALAFLDSVIVLTPEKFSQDLVIQDSTLYNSLIATSMHNDSLSSPADSVVFHTQEIDTLKNGADSLVADTLPKEKMYYSFHTELEFFTQETYTQYLTDYKRDRKEKLFFSFNEEPVDTVDIFPLYITPATPNWFLRERTTGQDTLKLWLTDTAMISLDSLWMEVCYPMFDSSNNVYSQKDTLLMRYVDPQQNTSRRQRRGLLRGQEETTDSVPEVPRPGLQIANNTGSNFDLDQSIALISPTPIAELRTDSLKLFRVKNDSVFLRERFRLEVDSLSLFRVWIHYKPQSETTYEVFFPDSVIHDIYSETNDTVKFRFTTRSEEYYGTIRLNLQQVTGRVLVQLLDTNEKLVKEQSVTHDGYIEFLFLDPKEYKLKVIFDRNGNGVWDTGNYLKHIQPEKVRYYPDPVNVRSNWELELPWFL